MNNQLTTQQVPCPVCQSERAEIFIEIPQAPAICNVLWPSRSQAMRVPRVDIPLAFCPTCAHIFNSCFDPALLAYSEAYENSLHFSPRFQQYADDLALSLVERHGLYEKNLIDIGGGKGDFLKLLCQLGNNRGISIDPSYAPSAHTAAASEQITFIQDYYSEKYADLPADFVCSRHTLEHIPRPVDFVKTVRRTLGERYASIVFFEVPNALFTLHDLAIWDIIYEHCSYFTAHSLAWLFNACGFQVQDVRETFAGQFLCLEATATSAPTTAATDGATLTAIAHDVAVFAERYRQKIKHDQAVLAEMQRSGKQVVVWGSGSKGITFLNMLQLQEQVQYAVDINPRKQGMYITGTGQQIVPPTFLQELRPDVVLVMNPVYLDEIRQIVKDLGLTVEFVLV